MSQENIGADQPPKSQIPGCFFGFLAVFIGGLGMLLILALFAGVTINQFNQIVKDADNPQEAQSLGNEEMTEGQPAPSDSGSTGQNTNACNATEYLQVTGVVVTEQYTDQYDTRICKFMLSIQSTHATDPIRYFYYQHKKDVYQGTESYQWMGNFPLSPYGETDWLGNIAIYNEKDAQGPVMSIPVKIAGIFDTTECSVYFKDAVFDEEYLASIAIPITSPCPLE